MTATAHFFAEPVHIHSDLFGSRNYGGAKARIDGRNVTFNSVRGYTIYNLQLWNVHGAAKVRAACEREGLSLSDYIAREVRAAISESRERGHDLVWISLSPTVLTAHIRPDEFAGVPELKTGELVAFDDALYIIGPAVNGNYRLIPA